MTGQGISPFIQTIVLDTGREQDNHTRRCWVCGDPIHPHQEYNMVRENVRYHLQYACLNCPQKKVFQYNIEVRVRYPA